MIQLNLWNVATDGGYAVRLTSGRRLTVTRNDLRRAPAAEKEAGAGCNWVALMGLIVIPMMETL